MLACTAGSCVYSCCINGSCICDPGWSGNVGIMTQELSASNGTVLNQQAIVRPLTGRGASTRWPSRFSWYLRALFSLSSGTGTSPYLARES
eukprot:6190856-Pleurochrysis_carterae.AAC.2